MKDIIYKNKIKSEILEHGIYHGYEWYIFDLGTHPTAYIKINSDNILFNKSYWEIEVINKRNTEDNLLHISNTLENILYVLERIEKKIYEED